MAFGDLDINKLGISKTDVVSPVNVYERYILELGAAVAQAFIDYIEKNDISATGGLKQSIVAVPVGNLQVQIQADEYYKFIDQGVNGIETKRGSDFSFKYRIPSLSHVQAIKEWIPSRSLSLPPTIPNFDSFAFAIASSITREGIKARNITSGVLTDKFFRSVEESLLEATGLILSFTFDLSTNQINKI